MPLTMKFCSQCGSDNIENRILAGDNMPRQVCLDCNSIFYSNPKVVVGAVVTYQGQYLLCKRNIPPQIGLWTYPGGFLEENETVEEGAIRETFEEAQAKITLTRLIGVYSLTAVNQVHLIYAAEMATKKFATTVESSEVELLAADEIPWKELAFPVIRWALKAHLDPNMQNQLDSKSTNLSLEDSLILDD